MTLVTSCLDPSYEAMIRTIRTLYRVTIFTVTVTDNLSLCNIKTFCRMPESFTKILHSALDEGERPVSGSGSFTLAEIDLCYQLDRDLVALLSRCGHGDEKNPCHE
jgi:hypothetical protein